jgi:hypothetical protein
MISQRVSVYSNISLVKYEIGTEMGKNVWLFGFPSTSPLGIRDAVPQLGIKFYF